MTGTRALLLLNPRARRRRPDPGEVEIRTAMPRTINVDGEPGPRTPATLVVVPRSLAVFCQ
ncbi:MAG: hypothetical protein ACREOC_08700 [Gemmatimonadales bacterium]